MLNASEELAASVNYTQIRLFTVAMQLSASPLVDFTHVWETWSMPNNGKIGCLFHMVRQVART